MSIPPPGAAGFYWFSSQVLLVKSAKLAFAEQGQVMLILNLTAFLFLFLYSVCSFLLISLSIKKKACLSAFPPIPLPEVSSIRIQACSDTGVEEGSRMLQVMGTGTLCSLTTALIISYVLLTCPSSRRKANYLFTVKLF